MNCNDVYKEKIPSLHFLTENECLFSNEGADTTAETKNHFDKKYNRYGTYDIYLSFNGKGSMYGLEYAF